MSEAQTTTAGIIPIREHGGKQAVSGRELHEFLQVGAEYRHWLPRMVDYGFTEGQDYAVISDRVARDRRGEVARTDHALTLDMAKELAMIQRTDRGRQARQYFIEVEKRARQSVPAPDISTPEGVLALAQTLTRTAEELVAAKHEVAVLEPKAAQADTLRNSDGLQLIGDVANQLKIHAQTNFPSLKVKQSDVFDLAGVVGLVIRGNTVRNNQPTARAIEAGWVKPAESTYETNRHGTRTKYYARLTHKGAGRLWDAAVTNLKTYGSVLAPKKEIAA